MIRFIANMFNFIRSLDVIPPPRVKKYAAMTDAFMGVLNEVSLRPEMISPMQAWGSLPDNLEGDLTWIEEVNWKRDGF